MLIHLRGTVHNINTLTVKSSFLKEKKVPISSKNVSNLNAKVLIYLVELFIQYITRDINTLIEYQIFLQIHK